MWRQSLISKIHFIPANLRIHRTKIVDLSVQYLNEVVEGINDYYKIDLSASMGISVRNYVERNIESLCSTSPPQGIFIC